MPSYVPPFSLIKHRFSMASSNGKIVATIDYEALQAVIRLLLLGIKVNEAWYLSAYPDIAEAMASGVISSAKSHFVETGYFEGRLPFPLEVNEEWYCSEYPDISEAINRGEVKSATVHFQEFGYQEGRLPGGAK